MVRPERKPARRCPQCGVISPGSAERCECGLAFDSPHAARVVTRERAQREFDLRQHAAGALIGLFVAGVIGPALLAMDHDRPYRGIFMIGLGALVFLVSLPAWFKLPKDQRTWKALRSPRGRS